MKTAIDVFLFTGRLAVVHSILLFGAAVVDIIFLGFEGFTIACFAVAGVFSSVFCFSPMSENPHSGRKALYALTGILVVCASLFFLIGPLSGHDYELPVRSYAVTEGAATIFFYATGLHKEFEKP